MQLELLGGSRLTSLGLGDDQDADGYETGFQAWEPELWKALGVELLGAAVEEPKKTDDDMKVESNFLRGTIAEGLEDTSTGALSERDTKLTKFHGIYQQDDRDLRDERKAQGLEKAFQFMVRVRVPGGISKASQWLAMDEIAEKYGSKSLKITTRQAYQLHGVLKRNLKQTIRDINKCLLDTLAACGDVNRNVMCSPNPLISEVHAEVQDFARKISAHLSPRTSAYHEIWLDDKIVAGQAVQDFEPLYGSTYLPRKFKIAIAIPPNNDVDVFAHDLGYTAIADNNGKLLGYNVSVGGGMGMTHNNKKTYPNLGQFIGFCKPDQAIDVGEKVMLVQRDYGDRSNRKHARLKYTIDDRDLDWFREEVESRLGYKLEPLKEYKFENNADRYGWTKGADGKWHFCMYIENGRVIDLPGEQIKTGLREIAKVHKGDFRLTPNQHLILGNIAEQDKEQIEQLLKKYKLDNLKFTGIRMNSMSCVALPTCGLAMAESERYLPTLVSKLEIIIEECGLREDAITIRMTGCPNGCARPYVAEIACVGKALGTYNLYLGGGFYGQRLNKLYKENLKEDDILKELKPMLNRYAKERNDGERFGDFVIRMGYIKATKYGKDFHEL
ncbi:sulfite reductase subunit beta [Rhizophagus clarus]|uniref:assimilatory sulfite reductase (NADPH) n=1 Tax=Rhizophagus clarus TaxID=94130 RepID=A0A8H3QIK2_9GLOM|nr:sulfite reductase subunit beta [Rhizophagus clarus]